MVRLSSQNMAPLVLVSLVLGLVVAIPVPQQGYQNGEFTNDNELAYMSFLNSRFHDIPYHLNRASRSNGKPTFIRFGKRSPPDSSRPLEQPSDLEWNMRY